MRMNRMNMRILVSFLIAFSGISAANAQLIKGNYPINGSEKRWMTIEYARDFGSGKFYDIKFDDQDNFAWDADLPERFGLVNLYADRGSIRTLIVEKGQTVVVKLKKGDKKQPEREREWMDFESPNKEATNYLGWFRKQMNLPEISGRNPDTGTPLAETVDMATSMQALDKVMAEAQKRLAKIKGAAVREFAARYTNALDINYRILIMKRNWTGDDSSLAANQEYKDVLAKINPNEPIGLAWKMPDLWVDSHIPAALGEKKDITDYALRYIEVMKTNVTNPLVKHHLLNDLVNRAIYTGGIQDVERFWNAVVDYAGDDQALMEKYSPAIDQLKATRSGKMAPDFTFQDIDGKSYKLSDLRGKVLYIDIWATWCGPCKKQIPHFAKVAEHFKDNPNIQLISVSVDSEKDREAWKKMIQDDKPAWPQYVISSDAEHKKMSADYCIAYIPRFMVINADGTVQDADAPRPSTENIIEVLNEVISKNH